MNRIYILDVDGVRLAFGARVPARTTPADRAELEAMLASVEIEPRRSLNRIDPPITH